MNDQFQKKMTNNSQNFKLGGKEFKSFDDLPKNIKKELDKNGDGKIDAFEDFKKGEPISLLKILGAVKKLHKASKNLGPAAPSNEPIKNSRSNGILFIIGVILIVLYFVFYS